MNILLPFVLELSSPEARMRCLPFFEPNAYPLHFAFPCEPIQFFCLVASMLTFYIPEHAQRSCLSARPDSTVVCFAFGSTFSAVWTRMFSLLSGDPPNSCPFCIAWEARPKCLP